MLYQYISTPMTSIPCPPASSMMKEGMVPDKAEHAKLQEQHTVKKLTKENKKNIRRLRRQDGKRKRKNIKHTSLHPFPPLSPNSSDLPEPPCAPPVTSYSRTKLC